MRFTIMCVESFSLALTEYRGSMENRAPFVVRSLHFHSFECFHRRMCVIFVNITHSHSKAQSAPEHTFACVCVRARTRRSARDATRCCCCAARSARDRRDVLLTADDGQSVVVQPSVRPHCSAARNSRSTTPRLPRTSQSVFCAVSSPEFFLSQRRPTYPAASAARVFCVRVV